MYESPDGKADGQIEEVRNRSIVDAPEMATRRANSPLASPRSPRGERGGAVAGDMSHEVSECRSPGARARARRIFGLS